MNKVNIFLFSLLTSQILNAATHVKTITQDECFALLKKNEATLPINKMLSQGLIKELEKEHNLSKENLRNLQKIYHRYIVSKIETAQNTSSSKPKITHEQAMENLRNACDDEIDTLKDKAEEAMKIVNLAKFDTFVHYFTLLSSNYTTPKLFSFTDIERVLMNRINISMVGDNHLAFTVIKDGKSTDYISDREIVAEPYFLSGSTLRKKYKKEEFNIADIIESYKANPRFPTSSEAEKFRPLSKINAPLLEQLSRESQSTDHLSLEVTPLS